MSGEKHTVHLREGGKVVIDGDRVEVHFPGPFVTTRKQYNRFLSPDEEANRTLYGAGERMVAAMLAEAFRAVPIEVVRDD